MDKAGDAPSRLTVGALVFPDFEPLDLYGPLEIYAVLGDRFDIRIVAETDAPVAARGGPRTAVDDTFADTIQGGRTYDILLVPGGMERGAKSTTPPCSTG